MRTGVGGDHEPRRGEGDVVERELDRGGTERGNVERVHNDYTDICTLVPYVTAPASPRSAQSQI